ncbi:MAG TPA: hypothetical protein VFY22_04030 [Hydrogenophaga sp.]|nr:hypothetical protein [Hydrogenophaga sp.]
MIKKLLGVFTLLAMLSGCASTDLVRFRERAASVQQVVVVEPTMIVTTPVEYLHQRVFTNEAKRYFSDEEMDAWKAFYEEHYPNEEVQARLKKVLTTELNRKGYRNVRVIQPDQANKLELEGRVLLLQFKSLHLSGIAFGATDSNKRVILTVSGKRVLRSGNVSWGDLHNTFISPRMKDERKGIVYQSEASHGKELAYQRLDEALQRWMIWALFPVPQQ